MKKLYFLGGILCCSSWVGGQSIGRPVTLFYTGPGAYSSYQADLFSRFAHPAALAGLSQSGWALAGEKRYLLNELRGGVFLAGLHTGSGNFGLNAGYSGFHHYRETQWGLTYGRKLGTRVKIGGRFNMQAHSPGNGYGKNSAYSAGAGAILQLTGEVQAGFYILLPVPGNHSVEKEGPPLTCSVGFGFDASPQFFIGVEMQQEQGQPFTINLGMQYHFAARAWARMGLSTANALLWMGAGFQWQSLQVTVQSGFHPQLGISPGILLSYAMKQKE